MLTRAIYYEGNKDVEQHLFPQLWPQTNPAPKIDMFHTQTKVDDSLLSSNPLNINFARMVSTACIEFSKTSQTHVLKHTRKNKNVPTVNQTKI